MPTPAHRYRPAATSAAGRNRVLLLNAVLTVRAHEAASHAGKGWEQLTDAVVKAISERKEGIVYLLWGSYAQRKGAIVDPTRNLVLKCPHPSPFSANNGFFRLPALLESQRIPRRARQGAGALVIRSLPCTEPESGCGKPEQKAERHTNLLTRQRGRLSERRPRCRENRPYAVLPSHIGDGMNGIGRYPGRARSPFCFRMVYA